MMEMYYLSFVDENKPEGERWIGGCYCYGPDPVANAWEAGCNPGGEVMIVGPIEGFSVKDGFMNILLDEDGINNAVVLH